MAFYDYHFVTHWRVKGSVQEVYALLKEGHGYARWWKPAYLVSEEIAPNKVRSVVRAKLPYTLTFVTEPLEENPPHGFTLKASGELEGIGRWEFRQTGETTDILFYWDVRATKPIVRWLSFFLKPLFRWNHDWVMRTGEKGLQAILEQQQTR